MSGITYNNLNTPLDLVYCSFDKDKPDWAMQICKECQRFKKRNDKFLDKQE